MAAGVLLSSWAGSGDTLKRKYGTMVVHKFLTPIMQRVGILPYCWNQDWETNTGRTLLLRRFNVDGTIMAEMSDGQEPTSTGRTIQTIEAALKRFAKAHDIDKETRLTGLGPIIEQLRKQVGFEVARDIDDYIYRTCAPLVQGSFGRLDSLAGNHQFFVTTSDGAAVDATTATTVVSTELTQANDYWNTGTMVCLDGNNAGLPAALVDDFVNATGTLSTTLGNSFEYRVLTGTRMLVSRNVGHTAQDPNEVITSEHLDDVMVKFTELGIMAYDGEALEEFLNVKEQPLQGYYIAGFTPAQYSDFRKDPNYKEVAVEGDAWKPSWSNYQVKRWNGFAIFSWPRQFRTTAPAAAGTAEALTFQANGAVHVATFMGQGAMSVSKLTGYGKGKAGIMIRYKSPGPQTITSPTDAVDVLSAEIYMARAVTMGCGGFNLATSARK
jgi:hypothetical protein